MATEEQLQADLKTAMKAREMEAVYVLRGLIAVVKNLKVEKLGTDLEESEISGLVRKEISKRVEAAAFAQKANRPDDEAANRREIVCPGGADFMARLDDRTIVYGSYSPAGPLATQRDLVTGQETAYPAGTTPDKFNAVSHSAEQRSVSGEYITVDPNGSVYRSNGAEPARTLIFECDCSKYRVPQFYSWAPDGQWVIMVYAPRNGPEQELWILSRDGSVAGTLASVGYNANASWYIEGKGILPKSQLTPVAR